MLFGDVWCCVARVWYVVCGVRREVQCAVRFVGSVVGLMWCVVYGVGRVAFVCSVSVYVYVCYDRYAYI